MQGISLAGGCYVLPPDALEFQQRENWREAAVIDHARGAKQLSSYLVRVGSGQSPIRSFPGCDVVIYVVRGAGELLVAGRRFDIQPETGAYVKPNEAFAVRNAQQTELELIVCVCPQCKAPRWLDQMPENFDAELPHRTVALSQRRKQKTGDRYFQLLVDGKLGCGQVTQFIGSIPMSRAPAHFHEYEEAIAVLSGRGYLWTGGLKAPVEPGSILYLPRRQSHSLECIDATGMQVMGTFYPAGSPAVRYDA